MDLAGIASWEGTLFRAWPAGLVVEHRGMRLRFMGGDSLRANSAAVYACDRGLEPPALIDAVEAFYRQRGRAPLVQVGPTAPSGLDVALASRGYVVEAPVYVQAAALQTVLDRARPVAPHVRIALDDRPREAWVDIEVTRGRFAAIASSFLAAMESLCPRAAFATAHVDGVPAAACLFVHDEDVVVLCAMRTLPAMRRRGAARTLLEEGARWAVRRGAAVVVLQVETENAVAGALYASAGFETQYETHYRVLVQYSFGQGHGHVYG